MNLKILILILTPAALLQILMFSPILTIPSLLVVIFIYVSIPEKLSVRQRVISIVLSGTLFLSFYFYSRYQFGLNRERGSQLYNDLKAYHHKYGKYPGNLAALSEETQSKIPMVRRGLINISFICETNKEDRFEFGMDYGFAPDKCYWRTDNGWDCNF